MDCVAMNVDLVCAFDLAFNAVGSHIKCLFVFMFARITTQEQMHVGAMLFLHKSEETEMRCKAVPSCAATE